MADDKDLNQYIGIKKYAPYRKGGNWDGQRPERLKEFREKLVAKRTKRNGEDGGVQVKKRKGKKERQRAKATATGVTGPETQEPPEVDGSKKRKRGESSEAIKTEVGVEGKKRKRRHKKSSQLLQQSEHD